MSGSVWTGFATPFAGDDWLAKYNDNGTVITNWSFPLALPFDQNLTIKGFTTTLGLGEFFPAASVDLASSDFTLLGTLFDNGSFTLGPQSTMLVLGGGVAQLPAGTMSLDTLSTLKILGQVKIGLGNFDGTNAIKSDLMINQGGVLDVGGASSGSFSLTSPAGLTFSDSGALNVGGNFTLQASGGTMSIVDGKLAMNQSQRRGADLIDNAGGTVSIEFSTVTVGVQPFETSDVLQLGAAGDRTIVDLTNSSIKGGSVVNDSTLVASITSHIALAGTYLNNGASALTEVNGGLLSFQSGGVSTTIASASAGMFAIESGGTLDIANNANVGGATVEFTNGGGALAISGSLSNFSSPILGLSQSDALELTGSPVIEADFNGVSSISVLKADGSTTIFSDITIPGHAAGLLDVRNSNGNGIVYLCYLQGTRILTSTGEVPIEDLRIGDLVLTRFSSIQPIKWIGRQWVDLDGHSQRDSVVPIRIRQGAFAENVPHRDLLVSPCHAMFLDGVLIQAGALVNGVSIVRETNMSEPFTYYHVELEGHSLIFAEGALTETFVDNVDRMAFDNWAEHQALFGQDEYILEMEYPRAKAARQVPRNIRTLLQARVAGFKNALAAAA
jgi:hypothetical protein